MEAKIDETDRQLLILLQQNSNITIKELAQKVSLSPTPVFERIKRLEQRWIYLKICGCTKCRKTQSRIYRVLLRKAETA